MDIQERLDRYLVDAHAIEEQALQQLERAPDHAGEPELARALREHRTETEGHERLVRDALQRRGRSPNRAIDAAMRLGGEGFVLFARSQTDTPGKLASHALSYEALEWASYDLLARTAERWDAGDVAEMARRIREEERAMMWRIEGLLDRTAEASLAQAAGDDLEEHLRHYLADAHAIEAQSIAFLEDAKGMVEHPALVALFEDHLQESRAQQELVAARLEARGGKRSLLKDGAMRLGAFNWGMFFRAQPDTAGKLAAFAYAFEHLEIGGYEQLARVARRAGDEETVAAAAAIVEEERGAASRIADHFEAALEETFAGVTT